MSNRPKARKRLRDIRVREVSFVDRPANLSPFLFFKAEGEEANSADPPAEGQAPANGTIGAVTSAVKQMVLEASANAIEKIQGIALAVGEAPVDDNASTGPVVASAFADIAKAIADLATQLAPPAAEPPAQDAMKSEVAAEGDQGNGDANEVSAPATAYPSIDEIAKAFSAAAESIFQRVQELAQRTDADVAKSSEDLRAALNRASVQMGTLLSRDLFKNSLPVGNGLQQDGARPPPAPAERHWPEDLAESARKRAEAR